jgi:dTDP-4-amino-4,6-dideoxygalactose transaminase
VIPRLKPQLDWSELSAALCWPAKSDIRNFENAFAREMKQAHCVAFPYGRTGLLVLLQALGLKNREIICPAYTCVVVPHAVVLSGNTPVFIDSKSDDFNMDLDMAAAAITEKTGAVIATSIFGYPVNLDKLEAIRKRYPHVKIIQDCAHSFAAEWQGKPVQQAGDAAIFGLNISKLITSVFGGMVTTDNSVLAARLREIRDQSIGPASFLKSLRRFFYLLAVYIAFWEPFYRLVNRLERSGFLDRFVRYYDESAIDMPNDYLEGLTSMEARVGLVQIRKYRSIIASRRKIASYYDTYLRGIDGLQLPPLVNGATYSHYVPCSKSREPLEINAACRGVQLGRIIDYCIPSFSAYRSRTESNRRFEHAERYAAQAINLPVHVDTDKGAKVVSALRECLQ